jgi:hypothetical protein
MTAPATIVLGPCRVKQFKSAVVDTIVANTATSTKILLLRHTQVKATTGKLRHVYRLKTAVDEHDPFPISDLDLTPSQCFVTDLDLYRLGCHVQGKFKGTSSKGWLF